MFRFGTKSEAHLSGVHADLVRVARRALMLSGVDFAVTDGVRTATEQRALVASGASQTLASRHLTGHAIDIAPAVNGQLRWDWPLFYRLADAMIGAAKMEAVPLRWGGAWNCVMAPGVELVADAETLSAAYVDACRRKGKKPILDGPHFELPTAHYPAGG